jgi:CRP/FNR family cyclic AMP-dependent transcriptional regulator
MNDTRFGTRGEILEGLRSARIVQGKGKIASELLEAGLIEKHQKGHKLLTRGAFDRDIYFVLAGSLAADINGHRQRCRGVGETIGELSTLSPDSRRTADVFVDDDSVLWRIPAKKFKKICLRHPEMLWLLTKVVAERLDQRNRHYAQRTTLPVVFIISSSEQTSFAARISIELREIAEVEPWYTSFAPGAYPLEALQQSVSRADFAIAIAAKDDIAVIQQTEHGVMRDNVLFEIGWFMSCLGRDRTFVLVEKGEMKLPSDLKGMTFLPYEQSDQALESKSDDFEQILEVLTKAIKKHGTLAKFI